MAWTKHFSGKHYGSYFPEFADFAKKSKLKDVLLPVAGQNQALEKLMALGFSSTLADLRKHGPLANAPDTKASCDEPGEVTAPTEQWRRSVRQILKTRSPVIGKLLTAYGEHVEGTAAMQEYLNRKSCRQTASYQVALEFVLKANRNTSHHKDSWGAAYRLVNALNGCYLAHYCQIDPRYSAVDLINSGIEEIATNDAALVRAMSRLTVSMVKPTSYHAWENGDDSEIRSEAELCVQINHHTADLISASHDDIY